LPVIDSDTFPIPTQLPIRQTRRVNLLANQLLSQRANLLANLLANLRGVPEDRGRSTDRELKTLDEAMGEAFKKMPGVSLRAGAGHWRVWQRCAQAART
jgi:hypothetical protein